MFCYTVLMKTPESVQRWLDSLAYNPSHTLRTLPQVKKHGRAHCLEGAMAAAAILSGPAQHRSGATGAGYPPLILDLESVDLLDHTLFLFRRRGKWGAIGKSRDIGLDGRKPVFKTIRALAQSYLIPYIDHRAAIKSFGVLNLQTLESQRWKDSKQNVWYVEEALRNMPHKPLKLSAAVTKKWRQKYRAWKATHPKEQPDYYPHSKTWL